MTEANEAKIEKQEKRKATGNGVSIRFIGTLTILVAIALAFYAFMLAGYIANAKDISEADESSYIQSKDAIEDMQSASDYLTSQVRLFVTTGRRSFMDSYLNELTINTRRENAVLMLQSNHKEDKQAADDLAAALNASNELAERELSAMKLACRYYKYEDVPTQVDQAKLEASLEALKGQDALDAALDLVIGPEYESTKNVIAANVESSSEALLEELNDELEANDGYMQNLLFQLRVDVSLLLCVIMILVLVVLMYVLKPLDRYIKRVEKNEPLEAAGSFELRYLAHAYNVVYEDNNKRILQLREFSERDPLTGISNRAGYNSFLASHTRDIALLLIDIDNFKEFNKVYGHDTGDAVMVKLARALSTAFRATDFPCRIESDKFAVIMTNMNGGLHSAVSNKIELVNSILADDSDDLPLITISVGAAFSTEGMDDQDIYRAASIALNHVQENGRNGLAFYGEHN